MLRPLIFIHRYLAVAVGLLMVLWCLSGFVMMYQSYPAFTDAERLASLEPLDLAHCCADLDESVLPAAAWRIEMLQGRPVLRSRGTVARDLATGGLIEPLTADGITRLAMAYAGSLGIDAQPTAPRAVQVDQWTLQTAARNQPAWLVPLGDAAGTHLYINGGSGEIFQDSTRRERVLSWLGAIPHWLYPTALRSNAAVWSQVVIWGSLLGSFLALLGLVIGIARFRRADGTAGSPFRGWWYWHHIAGLVFGVLTLTWVFSGLATMNPWGWLAGSDAAARLPAQIAGVPPALQLRQFLEQARSKLGQMDIVQLRAQPLGGQLYVVAYRGDGVPLRLDAAADPALLDGETFGRVLASTATVRSLELLQSEDAYYYTDGGGSELPVWRAILDDAQRTRVYASPQTGALRVVDADGRWMRWLEGGLHGLDFPGLRKRPLWDIATLLLLAGVTAVCITGGWMAIQRVRRDLARRG